MGSYGSPRVYARLFEQVFDTELQSFKVLSS